MKLLSNQLSRISEITCNRNYSSSLCITPSYLPLFLFTLHIPISENFQPYTVCNNDTKTNPDFLLQISTFALVVYRSYIYPYLKISSVIQCNYSYTKNLPELFIRITTFDFDALTEIIKDNYICNKGSPQGICASSPMHIIIFQDKYMNNGTNLRLKMYSLMLKILKN